MQFTVEIRLGNDLMQTGGDVARALREVADRIENLYEHESLTERFGTGYIRDLNGNQVGICEVKA